jgi:lipopolysaccharide biosynthesis protein
MNDIHNLMFPDWIKNHDDEKKITFVGENMVAAAGTMFWIRYSALHPRNLADALPTLDFRSGYTDILGVEHAIERLFASEVLLRERKIAAIAPPATTKLRGIYGGI